MKKVYRAFSITSYVIGTKKLTLVYPTPHPLAPSGLGSSTGRAAHRRCEGVGSIPTQVLRFFLRKKSWDLYTSVTGLNLRCS